MYGWKYPYRRQQSSALIPQSGCQHLMDLDRCTVCCPVTCFCLSFLHHSANKHAKNEVEKFSGQTLTDEKCHLGFFMGRTLITQLVHLWVTICRSRLHSWHVSSPNWLWSVLTQLSRVWGTVVGNSPPSVFQMPPAAPGTDIVLI